MATPFQPGSGIPKASPPKMPRPPRDSSAAVSTCHRTLARPSFASPPTMPARFSSTARASAPGYVAARRRLSGRQAAQGRRQCPGRAGREPSGTEQEPRGAYRTTRHHARKRPTDDLRVGCRLAQRETSRRWMAAARFRRLGVEAGPHRRTLRRRPVGKSPGAAWVGFARRCIRWRRSGHQGAVFRGASDQAQHLVQESPAGLHATALHRSAAAARP